MSLAKRIVLGVTGGIAAYKAAMLLRLLKQAGHEVRVVMTQSAQAFVQPLTFQALSGIPVYTDVIHDGSDNGMAHIDLAKWADLIVIAPASANCIASLAHGMASDLLSTLCLATKAPVLVAPAMNQQMWANKAVQTNTAVLQARGMKIIGPSAGEQACGDTGLGRMLEPDGIANYIEQLCMEPVLQGQHWVITAGPTREAIDPVRYLSNYSSGKMGYALAQAAHDAGARVTLISGPTALACPSGVKRLDVESAQDMLAAATQAMHDCDVFIAAAAVADYRVEHASTQKIKKQQGDLQLQLVQNPDIVATIAKEFGSATVVGFALETQHVEAYALDKLERKGLDMVIANSCIAGKTFGSDDHAVTVLTSDGRRLPLAKQAKSQLAIQIVEQIQAYCSQLIQSMP